jgi:hypothetical protein
VETGHVDEREPADGAAVERLRAENAALRAELDRLRERYVTPSQPRARTKKAAAARPEPEQFALVGSSERKPDEHGPPDETLDSVGETLCRILQERRPGTRWRYYRDQRLGPEGVTFFYAHEALRKMWGETGGNPDPPTPQAYRRLTTVEQNERDSLLQAALRRVDDALERSQTLHAQGQVVAAAGLLKYVDLLLARFNLALAQAQAGDSRWQDTLHDRERTPSSRRGSRPSSSQLVPSNDFDDVPVRSFVITLALLVGLLFNALAGWWWADPAAALVIAGFALHEGRESWRGTACDCC